MAVTANTILPADLEPAISIDHTTRLVENIETLQRVLGITEMTPMAAGTLVKMYRLVKTNSPEQVGAGDEIKLTKITRKLADTKELVLKKYRKLVAAEDIQKVGREIAINRTDEKLIAEVRKEVKADFFNVLKTGTGTATGNGLQECAANLWGELKVRYEDIEFTPVFFLNPVDVAKYLGKAAISTQTAFGFAYIENFLGLGNAFLSAGIDTGKIYATASQNLNGVYANDGGDVAETFGMTSDESGLVLMSHNVASDRASIDTLIMCGVLFYPEELDGVFVGTITVGP